MNKKNISVIVPVYNEEATLTHVLTEIYSVLNNNFKNFEIIIIDDHSKDKSFDLANNFALTHNNVILKKLEKNFGSGKAIYSGIIIAKHELIIYIPADGQFNCEEITKYAEAAENADIILGVRSDRHDYTLFRKLSSFIFIKTFNFLFNTSFKDINWIHLWNKKIFNDISINSEGIFFLGELVAKSKNKNYKIIEIPSLYLPRKGGIANGGKISSIFKTIKEMIKIKFTL